MPLPATLPPAILETVLVRLAPLFLSGAGGDTGGARQAALHMLDAYHPQTEDELCLAASIISFSFQALDALGQAADPNLPVTRVLRLRGSAVSLSRESAKADRRLAALQKTRQQPVPAEIQPEPKIEQAVPPAKVKAQTWTQTYEQRQTDLRIAASLKRAEARVAALSDPTMQRTAPVHQSHAAAP